MKFKAKHFKFEIYSRRFKAVVWTKYYALKKKEKLSEYDKFWMRQLRSELKLNQFKLIGTHLPTSINTNWIIKKDLSKENLNKIEHIQQLKLKIKEKRKKMREMSLIQKEFDGAQYQTIGNVFVKPETIKPLGAKLKTNDPFAPKTPRHTNKNYIGIELEFNVLPVATPNEQAMIADKLKAAGLARYVDVATDGSCGWEVRVLLLEDDFEQTLTKILDVLNSMGFPTNEKCGTHIHFDMRNRDVKVIYQNLFKTQKFLRKFLTRNRKYNTYCKLNKAETFEKQMSIGDRYYAINVEAYKRHKTLEVRMHQGTLIASELIPWIKLLTRVVNYKETVVKPCFTLKQAKKQFDIDNQLSHSLEERMLMLWRQSRQTPIIERIADFVHNLRSP